MRYGNTSTATPIRRIDAIAAPFGSLRARVAADAATISGMTVDGATVEPTVDGSIVTIPLDPGHGDVINVMVVFSFVAKELTVTEADPMSSDALQPSEIGLLARSTDVLMLGHWFPIWVPEGLSADAELGDISNFPAATIVAHLDVPEGSVVVTSGKRLDRDHHFRRRHPRVGRPRRRGRSR